MLVLSRSSLFTSRPRISNLKAKDGIRSLACVTTQMPLCFIKAVYMRNKDSWRRIGMMRSPNLVPLLFHLHALGLQELVTLERTYTPCYFFHYCSDKDLKYAKLGQNGATSFKVHNVVINRRRRPHLLTVIQLFGQFLDEVFSTEASQSGGAHAVVGRHHLQQRRRISA